MGGLLMVCCWSLFFHIHYDTRHAGLHRWPNLHLSRIQSEYMALVDGDYHAPHLYGGLLRSRTIRRLRNADILYISCHLWILVLEIWTEERTKGGTHHALPASADTPRTPRLLRHLGCALPHPHPRHQLHRTRIRQLRQCA